MRADSQVKIFTDNIDGAIQRVRLNADLGELRQETCNGLCERELHGCDACRASNGSARLPQTLPDHAFSQFGFAKHHDGVPVEVLAGVSHAKMP
ncbi:hypothetical protein DYST_00666 [Dyella terrae]|nr:hypothetical protein DYST_00666 [Dyella terrae]